MTIGRIRFSRYGRARGRPAATCGDQLALDDDHSIGIYSAERSIIDAFRFRHLDGADLANDALKRWLRQGGQPSELLKLSRSFPRSATAIRKTLEILL